MALFGSFTHADRIFADQFEPIAEDDFIYRKSQRGAPIKVSSSERDAFVDRFVTSQRRAQWILMLAMLVLVALAMTIFDAPDTPRAEWFIYAGVGILVIGFLMFWRWAWDAPRRALSGRCPQGPALGKKEARRAAIERMSWGQFAWSGIILVIGGAKLASKVDVLSGWNCLWLIAGVLFVGLLAWRAWQKWRIERFPD